MPTRLCATHGWRARLVLGFWLFLQVGFGIVLQQLNPRLAAWMH